MKMVIDLTESEEKLLSKILEPVLGRDNIFDYNPVFKYGDETGKTVFKGGSISKGHKNAETSHEYNLDLDVAFFLKKGISGIIEALKGIKFSDDVCKEMCYTEKKI